MKLFESFRKKLGVTAVEPRTDDRAQPSISAPPTGMGADTAAPAGTAGSAEGITVPRSETRASLVNPATRRVLLVGADPAALEPLSLALQHERDDLRLEVIGSGGEALAAMEQTPCDALIVDLQLADMSGVDLLNETLKRHPRTQRFIRCETGSHEQLKQCAAPAPHVLPSHCDAEMLESNLDRAFMLQAWMENRALKKLIARIHQYPSLPALYTQVMAELESPKVSIEFVARLISKDPVMTAKILQVVNSPFFGLPEPISDTVQAVIFIGTERTKSLVLTAKLFSQFDNCLCAGFSPAQLWHHSMAVGTLARLILLSVVRDTKLANIAFTAGLLHDVGKLLLAANVPDDYGRVIAEAERRQVPVHAVEQEVFGATHAELGACLLGIWGLPAPILEGIAWHHSPGKSDHKWFSVLTAVHVANGLEHEKRTGKSAGLDTNYLADLGLSEHQDRWREICGCASVPK